MLPVASRLRHRDEFSAVLRRGRRAACGVLVVHLVEPGVESAAPAKAGFLVGRAVGNAVTRNKTRRRLRHLTGARLDSMPAGSAVVVRALPGAATASFAELERAFDGAWRRLPRKAAS